MFSVTCPKWLWQMWLFCWGKSVVNVVHRMSSTTRPTLKRLLVDWKASELFSDVVPKSVAGLFSKISLGASAKWAAATHGMSEFVEHWNIERLNHHRRETNFGITASSVVCRRIMSWHSFRVDYVEDFYQSRIFNVNLNASIMHRTGLSLLHRLSYRIPIKSPIRPRFFWPAHNGTHLKAWCAYIKTNFNLWTSRTHYQAAPSTPN